MTQIVSYLSFNGNCREAMSFYRDCLGGELRMQTVGEIETDLEMPKNMADTVLQATLSKGQLVLMGSDLVESTVQGTGARISLMLQCSNEAELRQYFQALSAGGTITQSLQTNHWGALSGLLTDRFGIAWQLYWAGHAQRPLPEKLAAPARRALAGAGIHVLGDLAGFSQKAVAALHGMGPNAMQQLNLAMDQAGINWVK
ncbi:MAG TPA: VOC family protein [Saprospiraceae bacterium]|nr:VOC family protein [Saprospiraceae bacterium]